SGSSPHLARQTAASMREDVVFAKSRQIEPRPRRQEAERCLGKVPPSATLQHGIKFGLDRMQMQHVRGSVRKLLIGELFCAPVRALLLFGQLDACELLSKIFEPMPVRVGAHEL